MIVPEYLKQGDKIGLVATARKISKKELSPAINLLESWGLQILCGDNLFQEYNQFSGTISQRVCDIQQMIDDDDIVVSSRPDVIPEFLVIRSSVTI